MKQSQQHHRHHSFQQSLSTFTFAINLFQLSVSAGVASSSTCLAVLYCSVSASSFSTSNSSLSSLCAFVNLFTQSGIIWRDSFATSICFLISYSSAASSFIFCNRSPSFTHSFSYIDFSFTNLLTTPVLIVN